MKWQSEYEEGRGKRKGGEGKKEREKKRIKKVPMQDSNPRPSVLQPMPLPLS